MKNKLNLLQMAMVVVLTAAVTWLITYSATIRGAENDIAELLGDSEKYAKLEEIQKYVDQHFVGEYDEAAVMEAAAEGYVDGLGDQWSYYMSADRYQQYKSDNSDRYVGIGITVNYDDDANAILVLDVIDNSPADQAEILPMDYIVAVNGEAVADLGYEGAVNALVRDEGVKVNVTMSRNGETTEKTLTCQEVVKQYIFSELLEGNVGYIRITEFSSGAQDGFLAAVENLLSSGADSFVFDVRNNPGGDLNVLISILDRILDKKDLFIEEYQNGQRYTFTSDETGLSYPMAVLCNQHSYSAAEYFAAVLQEYDVATVVGEATTGKGYGQSTIELSDGSAMVLSVIRYYTPEGRSLKESGVTPDQEVALAEDQMALVGRMDPTEDAQLAAAVAVVQ
ncbi:MAG: PDZ domain-containing protein [Ruminococcaceae bacterium]|nr:PDZ domain-containing protein [Oscillospiraceae bacterium]